MQLTQDTDQQIISYSKELRLPIFRRDFKEIAIEAAKLNQDYETFLVSLMEKEYLTRLENRKKSQIRQAGFPSKMYLNDLQRELLPKDAIDKLPQLERLDFIDLGQNMEL